MYADSTRSTHSTPRPLCEPINSAAVDQGGEHSASCSEGVSNRTHADHNVHSVLYTTDEVTKYPVPVPLRYPVLLGHGSNFDYDLFIFIRFKQVWNLSYGGLDK